MTVIHNYVAILGDELFDCPLVLQALNHGCIAVSSSDDFRVQD